ncbi:hypothetical protein Mthe_0947 [Methanothrix thermoacetophila PT]|uniref:Uncharacterized protein n=1 Tax=Methanothrix thermoacetophila (strain DSM 6194 / JCM 14653 / NBRC 101360 / PT) TaxID=349307 RepID=A0B7R1_METTP|nr:hypothetical protein Mthe_0947 [Methanothrix thermoacetophila PT]
MVERDAYSDLVFWEDLDPDAEEGDLQALKEMIERCSSVLRRGAGLCGVFSGKECKGGQSGSPGSTGAGRSGIFVIVILR